MYLIVISEAKSYKHKRLVIITLNKNNELCIEELNTI